MGCYVLGFEEIDQAQVAVVGSKGALMFEALRKHISPEDGPPFSDTELYNALPRLLQGHVWAGYVD